MTYQGSNITSTPDLVAIIDGDFIVYQACFSIMTSNGNLNDLFVKINEIIYSLLSTADTKNYVGFLGGPGNFRDRIAINKGNFTYKGNRTADKPTFYYEARTHLHDVYKFNIVNGAEADDACGIISTRFSNAGVRNVIISTDKDLLQIPGEHIRVRHRGELEYWKVNKEGTIDLSANRKKLIATGDKLLYAQVLMGDASDNFKGIPNMGPVATYNILKDYEVYELEFVARKAFDIYYEDKGPEMFKIMFSMAFILRENKHLSTPKITIYE